MFLIDFVVNQMTLNNTNILLCLQFVCDICIPADHYYENNLKIRTLYKPERARLWTFHIYHVVALFAHFELKSLPFFASILVVVGDFLLIHLLHFFN